MDPRWMLLLAGLAISLFSLREAAIVKLETQLLKEQMKIELNRAKARYDEAKRMIERDLKE